MQIAPSTVDEQPYHTHVCIIYYQISTYNFSATSFLGQQKQLHFKLHSHDRLFLFLKNLLSNPPIYIIIIIIIENNRI